MSSIIIVGENTYGEGMRWGLAQDIREPPFNHGLIHVWCGELQVSEHNNPRLEWRIMLAISARATMATPIPSHLPKSHRA